MMLQSVIGLMGGNAPKLVNSLINVPYTAGDYIKVGASFTETYNTSSINLTGTNIPNQNNYILLKNFYSDCENLKFTTNVLFSSTGGTDYGGSVRIVSRISGEHLSFLVGGASGVNKGSVQIYSQGALVNAPPTLTVLNTNDTLRYTIYIIKNVITFTVENITSGGSASTSYTFSFSSSGTIRLRSPLYTIGFGTSGGNYTFSSCSVISNDLTLCDLFIIGDSKTYGLFAGGTSAANRYAGIWQTDNPTKRIYVSAGSGERSSDWVLKQAEYALYRPKKAIICAPSNDPRNGVSQATTQANISSIKTYLESLGCIVYYQNPFIENVGGGGVDQSGLVTVGQNLFVASKIIPSPWTAAQIATYLDADGVHPNSVAQSLIKAVQSSSVVI